MTTATSRQNIRRALYDRVPGLGHAKTGLGFSGTADSVASTSVTDTFRFGNTVFSSTEFRGAYIYRPDLSGDDVVKIATTVNTSTGALSHGGSNYSDTSDTNYEIVFLMHPEELNACIQRAQRRIYFDQITPHTGELVGSDGDMETSGVGSWSSVGTPSTKEKSTTASRIYSGTQSLHVANDGAGEGAQSATFRVFPTDGGEWLYISAVVHADAGTAELHLYDVDNSASLASVTSAEEGFVHLWMVTQVDTSSCENAAIQLLGTESTADLYWNHVVVYRMDRASYPAPSWLDEQWKFMKLREAQYRKTLDNQTEGGYDDATSRVWRDWIQPHMFNLEPLHLEANPYQVRLMRPTPHNELWIAGKRPYSDVEALGTESATTLAPLDLVYAYSKDEIAMVLRKRYPQDERWPMLQREAEEEIDAEVRARVDLALQPIKREYWGRV